MMEILTIALKFLNFGFLGISMMIVILSFFLLCRENSRGNSGGLSPKSIRTYLRYATTLAILSLISQLISISFPVTPFDINGTWRYNVIANNGNYKHGGLCDIVQQGNNLKFSGLDFGNGKKIQRWEQWKLQN